MGGQGDSRKARPNLYYPLNAPDNTIVFPKKKDGTDGAWRRSKEKVEAESGRIEWIKGKSGWSPYFQFISDTTTGRPPETIWFHSEVGSNRTRKLKLRKYFPMKLHLIHPNPHRYFRELSRLPQMKVILFQFFCR